MVRMAPRRLLASAAMIAASFGAARPTSAAPISDYIAVGDSMAFGETDFTHNPSNGDRGYVSLYANFLAGSNGGVRPNVINLGVDGETSSTFFNGSTVHDGTPGNPAPQWNTNYPNTTTTQNSLLLSTIANEQAAGHVIGTISVQLGANDLLANVASPAFLALSPAEQMAAVGQALAGVQASDTKLLGELKTLAPNANILMLGYHNPFNADPTSPIGKIADPAIKALNTLIAGEASAFGAKYVDTYTPFLGHELADTYIATGNVHPNAAGYALIAGQLEAVPEPGTIFVVAAGFGGLLLYGRAARVRRVS
jgi:lysophospholipase L1-like esterase